jgi:hypothetical protein
MSSLAAGSNGTRAVGYVTDESGGFRVSLAAPGDTNLDGSVNLFDVMSIANSGVYGTGEASVWGQGDFNYDGVANLFDILALLDSGEYNQGGYFAAAAVSEASLSPTAVPEPSLWLVAACGLGGLLASRRKPRATDV